MTVCDSRIYDTARAFRLSHLTQGSDSDFNTSQNCKIHPFAVKLLS